MSTTHAVHALPCTPHCPLRPPHPLALASGEWVIVTAGGSALGRQAISYAKSIGVRTVATVRRADQKQELKDLG